MDEKYVATKEFEIGGKKMPAGTEIFLFRGFAYMNGYRLTPSYYDEAKKLTESDAFIKMKTVQNKV